MTETFTRRHALALSGAALAAGCVDNKAISQNDAAAQAPSATGPWSSGVSLPFPVQEIYPCAHEGAVHLAGGFVAENGRITGPTAAHNAWSTDKRKLGQQRDSLLLFTDPTRVTDDGWLDFPSLPTARHHPHMISFEHRLLAFAGFQSTTAGDGWRMQASGWSLPGRNICRPFRLESVDAKTGERRTIDRDCEALRWTPIPDLPRPCAEAVVGVTGDDILHLAGGRMPKGIDNVNWNDHIDTDHHFVLTDLNSEWQTAAPCLSKRNSAAGDVIDGNLHVVGGRTVSGGNVATHEVYDHREDRWRTAAPMPQAQGGLAAAAVAGRLYTFGGEYFDNGGGVYKEAWAYDPATDAWSPIPDMPNPRHGLGAVALEGKIYIIGGALQASGVDTSAIVDVFEP